MSNRSKICLITLWFGELPTNFPVWLKSVEYNNDIDFLIFTDQNIEYNVSGNVKITKISFEEMKRKIQKKYEFDISLTRAYKLCDFKVAYGDIFEAHIKEYDFWGYCDIDLIFGDIRKFISEELLNNYTKILSRGHFTLFKNTKEINTLYKKNNYYKEVFTTPKAFGFDEWGENGINHIFLKQKHDMYNEVIFEDIDISKYAFYSAQLKPKYNSIYIWKEGKLFKYSSENKKKPKEIMYAHHQKRKMTVKNADKIKKSNIIIISPPNNYTPFNEKENLDTEIIRILKVKKPIYIAYIKFRFLNLVKKLKGGIK